MLIFPTVSGISFDDSVVPGKAFESVFIFSKLTSLFHLYVDASSHLHY